MVPLDSLMKIDHVQNVKVEIIQQDYSKDPSKIEEVLWYRERYWRSQLFIVTHGMNSINEINSKKCKEYRK